MSDQTTDRPGPAGVPGRTPTAPRPCCASTSTSTASSAPTRCAKIQAHLDECGPCLKEYDLDTTLKSLIKRSCECEEAPEALRLTIMSRISMTVIQVDRG